MRIAPMKWLINTAAFISGCKLVLPFALLLVLASTVTGQQISTTALSSARMPTEKQVPLNPPLAGKLVIGPGDLLTVSVFNVPELLQTIRVSETGEAALSLIG